MAQQIKLPDGRNLDYLVAGPSDGFPFVWIHGTPGSYPQLQSLTAACEKKGVRVISLSRAGYGGSTRHKGRRIIDAVADIHALLQHLGVQRCVVGGWSGGGPHALACAARLPGCAAALCVAGVAPFDVEGLDWLAGQGEDNIEEFHAAQKGEPELQNFCEAQRPDLLQADAAGIVKAMASLLPEVDVQALTNNDAIAQHTVESMHEGLKTSANGWVDDSLAFIEPWGFELSEINVPVLLYQGSEDKMVPYAHGQWLAKNLPQGKLRTYLKEGEGHISIFLGQENAMIDELLAIAKS